jgi:hypothetical protein
MTNQNFGRGTTVNMQAGGAMRAPLMRWAQRNAIWFVAAIVFLALVFAEFRYGDPAVKDVLSWAGTIGSTFVGAALAFTFNAIKSHNERDERECVAGNLALITLVEFLDRLLQYQSNYIQPARGKRDAWVAMRPGKLINIEFKIDKNSLAFLLTKHPNVWREIVLEETRFSVLEDAISDRNNLINEIVWPKMEAKGIAQGASIELARIEEILGPAATQNLKNSTQYIMETCMKDIETISKCIEHLRTALMQMYPRREFLEPPVFEVLAPAA